MKSSTCYDVCLVEVKVTRTFHQIFVAFLEKLNFNQIQIHQKLLLKNVYLVVLLFSMYS